MQSESDTYNGGVLG